MIDLCTDYDNREIAAIIAEDREEERRRSLYAGMEEFCENQVAERKAYMFGYANRLPSKPVPAQKCEPMRKSEPRPERAPEPISDFMARLLTRYGVNPTGMTAIEAHTAYRNVPNHIKARVHAEMRKNRLDRERASR